MPNDKTAAAEQAAATAGKGADASPDTAATAAKTAPATTLRTATAGSATLPGTGGRNAAITVLVTGANGQLGNEMRRIAATAPGAQTAPTASSAANPAADATTAPATAAVPAATNTVTTAATATVPGSVRYLFTDVAELDITDPQAVRRMVRENDVEVIVNCAAYTNVNKAEEDEATADLINHRAVANLAAAAREQGATLIHISTDYVFGGDGNVPRREDDPVSPLGVYGRTKLAGEKAVAEAGCAALILRTAWLYSEFGNNFVKTMLRLTAQMPQVKVVFDQAGTPTYAADLAGTIHRMISSGAYRGNEGTYHFSNEGVCSWYDFAHEIAVLAGLDPARVTPCHSEEFPSPVERPRYSVLDKTKIKETFNITIPYWRDALERCLERLGAQTADTAI